MNCPHMQSFSHSRSLSFSLSFSFFLSRSHSLSFSLSFSHEGCYGNVRFLFFFSSQQSNLFRFVICLLLLFTNMDHISYLLLPFCFTCNNLECYQEGCMMLWPRSVIDGNNSHWHHLSSPIACQHLPVKEDCFYLFLTEHGFTILLS